MPTTKRLQGADFVNASSGLKLIAYLESRHGNICGFYARPGRKTLSVHHWMNDSEIDDFEYYDKNSTYRLNSIEEAKRLRIENNEIIILPIKCKQKSQKQIDNKSKNLFNELFPNEPDNRLSCP